MPNPTHPAVEAHGWLSSKIAALFSWFAAFLGLGTFAGIVSTTVGILSGCWLVVQLWNYFKYTLPLNKAKLEAMNKGATLHSKGDSE